MNDRTLRAGWARLWLLRIHRQLLESSPTDETLEAIRRGLTRLRARGVGAETDAEALKARVARMLARTRVDERIAAHPLYADAARVFGLDAAALRVLAFATALHASEAMLDAVRSSRRYPGTRSGFVRLLGDALGMPLLRMRRTLRARGPLLASGLVTVFNGNYADASEALEPGHDFAHLVEEDATSVGRVLDRLFERAGPGRLAFADYPHLGDALARLRDYLAAAARGRHGANVLLHGPPGTGKSELARVLAEATGLDLYLVRSADEDGEPIEGAARLHAYEVAQRALATNPRALLLFDEFEDVVRSPASARGGEAGAIGYKSWINRSLELARVPCLWIGNRTGCLDDSQLRRFDIALEVVPPPRQARRDLLERTFGTLGLPAPLLDEVAAHEAFAPAHFARAARVVERLGVRDAATAERVLRGSLDEILVLQGMRPLARRPRGDVFDPAFVRVDQPLEPILALLEQRGDARLCLYGPPGTGKTALAAHIAARTGRPLHKKRAADLLGPYLGETEANIARMFRDAERDGAVLCLDEADSFLRDREGAQRSWEVTQVNELLTRLEDHDGIVVASTNLMGTLDAAALRRFDFKLRFDWLDLAQRRAMFAGEAARFGLVADLDDAEREQGLRRLDRLAPGDFAALRRRFEAAPGGSERVLLEALAAELALKPGAARASIGFTR